MARTPAARRRRATAGEMPQPVSLTTTGNPSSRGHARDRVQRPAEVAIAAGLRQLLGRVQVDAERVGLDARDHLAHRRGRHAPASLDGAEVGEQVDVGRRAAGPRRSGPARGAGASRAGCRARTGSRGAAAAAARSRLIAPATGVPPVIPVTMSGAAIGRPSSVVASSISAAARSGSAQWTRWTSSNSVGRWKSAAPDAAIARWSALRWLMPSVIRSSVIHRAADSDRLFFLRGATASFQELCASSETP